MNQRTRNSGTPIFASFLGRILNMYTVRSREVEMALKMNRSRDQGVIV